ncbi:hypothetical protein GCM10025867_40000 [Frondihabitans sucicola]|uniref:DUF418 domain-containing protein n=1 Tax=Frondihabitans sucicola TaxID=1268041 RepID=A0ABN6Y3V1_9MICO|nr:hypothetical protein [Frondihabitans sucicola]BDZ51759.1 hypothetical protein GCM10025867_40000 [Frondihabitans sucicola]
MTPGGVLFTGAGSARLRDVVFASEPHSSTLVDMVGSAGVALAVIGVCGVLARQWRSRLAATPAPGAVGVAPSRSVASDEQRRGGVSRPGTGAGAPRRAGLPLRLLAGVGAMPLTVYTAHLLVIAVLSHSGFLASLTAVGEAGVLVAFVAGSCALAAAWRGRPGPLERFVAAVARRVSAWPSRSPRSASIR